MSYPDEEKKIIVEYFTQFKSATKVIEELGYPSLPSIHRWVQEAGADASFLKRGTFTMDERLKVIQKYIKNDYNTTKTALQYNNRPTTMSIRNWIRDIINNDIPNPNTRTMAGLSKEDIKKVKRKYRKMKNKLTETEQLREAIKILHRKSMLTTNDLIEAVDELLLYNNHNVSQACRIMNIPRGTYLYHKNRRERPVYPLTRMLIRAIFYDSHETYGYRRIMYELDDMGCHCSERQVRKIMREEGLVPRLARHNRRPKPPITPDERACPNLINRDFKADEPARKLFTDVTQMKVGEQWLYVSTILDGFDGALVGSSVSLHPNAEFAVESLVKACEFMGDDVRGAIIHSDRGALYSSDLWVDACERYGLVRSMSARGCCGDNAMMEGYHGIMKNEFWHGHWDKCRDINCVMKAYNNYVDFYNYKRKKTVLNGLTPIQYRASFYKTGNRRKFVCSPHRKMHRRSEKENKTKNEN